MAVSEHSSFSKAADILYVSQPAVSKSIQAIEQELGTELFIRQGKQVSLTEAGKIFRDFLQEYDREYKATIDHIKSLDRNEHAGTVTIGCDITWNAAHFYKRLSRHFAIHHPGMELEVLGLDSDSFLTALRSREVDVMIMYTCDARNHPDIEVLPFVEIGSGFLASSSLSSKTPGKPDISDLDGQNFLICGTAAERSGKLIYNKIIMDYCRNMGSGFQPRHCRSLSAALVEVSCGKGVLFVSDWASAVSNSEYRYYPVDDKIDLCLAYLAGSSPQVQFFAEETVRVFKGYI